VLPAPFDLVPERVWAGLSLAGLLLAVASLALMPWLLVRLPPDALLRPAAGLRARLVGASPGQVLLILLRNLLGVLLLLAGITMLFLPGQGLLTMAAGLGLLDLPLRHRLLVWLLRRPSVARAVDRLRARAGASPLLRPDTPEPPAGYADAWRAPRPPVTGCPCSTPTPRTPGLACWPRPCREPWVTSACLPSWWWPWGATAGC